MFKKATKEKGRLRLALMGPPGSGKTFTALALAAGMSGDSIALIDTERGSASLYAGIAAEFDVLELESFEAENYLRAIEGAAKAGYGTLIIDSLSHAWNGVGGILERVDDAGRRSKNSFTAWKDVTPVQNRLIDAILSYPGHVIVTLRTKVEYVVEEDSRGKKAPRKVGMAPVQRDGLEYEFTIVMEMDQDHRAIVTKSRFPELADKVIERPGRDIGERLIAWLAKGVPAAPKPAPSHGSAPSHEPSHQEATPARETPRPAPRSAAVERTVAERVANALNAFQAPAFATAQPEAQKIADGRDDDSAKLSALTDLYNRVRRGQYTPPAPAPAPSVERTPAGLKALARAQQLMRASHRAGVADAAEAAARDWEFGPAMSDADLVAFVSTLEAILEGAK